ncbi:MAG: hypothetical protein PVG32_19640 [Anaerolineales bacterium]|jgi:hypothetical protein
MLKSHESRPPLLVGFFVLILVTVPYVSAVYLSGDEYSFSGFLFNPLDGNSYIAKMYQGFRGDWLFKLPYTAEPGDGGYLFLFYIALGHLSRIFHLELIITYHLFRLVGTIVLLISLYWFYANLFTHSQIKHWAFTFTVLGSGMGWVLLPFGEFTADFWIAEIYPFLSSYANPHFTLGLAIILIIFSLYQQQWEQRFSLRDAIMFVLAFALSIIAPFGVIIIVIVFAVIILWKGLLWRNDQGFVNSIFKSAKTRSVVAVIVGGTPALLYDYWVARTDPTLAIWNAQNVTLSPPLWDVLLSLSPFILFAIFEIYVIINRKDRLTDAHILLMVWLAIGLVTMYVPFSLQRRFAMGLYIPTIGLAALAIRRVTKHNYYRYRLLSIVFLLLAIPTNLIILLSAQHGIKTHDPMIFLSQDEVEAYEWIEINTLPDSLILASPSIGLFIPANTGRRVIYGHPYETANAEVEKQRILNFFAGDISQEDAQFFLKKRGVDYLYYGDKEKELGEVSVIKTLKPVFSNHSVVIYRVD